MPNPEEKLKKGLEERIRKKDSKEKSSQFNNGIVMDGNDVSTAPISKGAKEIMIKAIKLQKNGEYQKSIDHYLDVIRIEPEWASAYNNLATVYASILKSRDDTWDKGIILKYALYNFDQAIEKDPNPRAPVSNKGILLFSEGKEEEGLELLRKAAKDENLDLFLASFGRIPPKKISDLRYKEMEKYQAKLLYNYGVGQLKTGDFQDSFKTFELVIGFDRGNFKAYNNAGNAKFRMGNKKEAKVWYKKSLEINPEYTNAQKNLELVTKIIERSK